jgi:hypothetical protein
VRKKGKGGGEGDCLEGWGEGGWKGGVVDEFMIDTMTTKNDSGARFFCWSFVFGGVLVRVLVQRGMVVDGKMLVLFKYPRLKYKFTFKFICRYSFGLVIR